MKAKETYNLTRVQKISLVILAVIWFFSDPEKRKPWHEVKKGLEKHECNFTVPTKHPGIFRCEHVGCVMCDDLTII